MGHLARSKRLGRIHGVLLLPRRPALALPGQARPFSRRSPPLQLSDPESCPFLKKSFHFWTYHCLCVAWRSFYLPFFPKQLSRHSTSPLSSTNQDSWHRPSPTMPVRLRTVDVSASALTFFSFFFYILFLLFQVLCLAFSLLRAYAEGKRSRSEARGKQSSQYRRDKDGVGDRGRAPKQTLDLRRDPALRAKASFLV